MEYIQQQFDVNFSFRVFFSRDLFDPTNTCLSAFLESKADAAFQKKLLVVLDGGVAASHPGLAEKISYYLMQVRGFRLAPEIVTLAGGESVKNDLSQLFSLVDAIDQHGIDRHSYVIGVGGGSSAARLAILAALVTLGIAVYFAALQLLGVVTLKELAALQRKS